MGLRRRDRGAHRRRGFAWLDAPVRRVAATDTFVAYAPELEDVILPQVESPARGDRVDRRLLRMEYL